MNAPSIKICGLSTPDTVEAAVEAGVRYIGFNFFSPSPRAVSPGRAVSLAGGVPVGVAKVGLFVDPGDDLLDAVSASVPLDMVQINSVTDPARLSAIRDRVGLPLIAAASIATKQDVDAALSLGAVADMLLFDAKAAPGALLPGGNGVAFDWRLLSTRRIPKPWMLAGGLTPENVAEAISLTGAPGVDVASGVESSPGVKDVTLIRKFATAAGISRADGTLPPPGLLLT